MLSSIYLMISHGFPKKPPGSTMEIASFGHKVRSPGMACRPSATPRHRAWRSCSASRGPQLRPNECHW